MAMYYVATQEELDGEYLVHRDGCPHMPQAPRHMLPAPRIGWQPHLHVCCKPRLNMLPAP